MDLKLVIAGGLFSLAGVLLGGLLTPLTQFFLERMRERRAAHRAKLLVASELLQAQMILRAASGGKGWFPIKDQDAFLPTSAWRDNRPSLAGMIGKDLWWEILMAYGLLEVERARLVVASKLPPDTRLNAEAAKQMKSSAETFGEVRKKLGLGGDLAG